MARVRITYGGGVQMVAREEHMEGAFKWLV